MIDDEFRAGEALVLEWIGGRTSLTDDPAVLVVGMARELSGEAREFGGEVRGFLVTIGNAARQAARGPTRPMPAGAPTPVKAQPSPEAPSPPPIDVDEFIRARREHALRERLQEMGRHNEAAWQQQPLDTFWRS